MYKMGLLSLFRKSDTLYFPGCMIYYKYKENFELYQKIFSRLGISFIVLEKSVCCGIEALEAGYEQEARNIARENYQFFKENNIKNIITTSPECYKAFTKNYPEFIPEADIEIKNIWELLLELLQKNNSYIRNKPMETITFHDNCYLGRYCNIYEAPRKILEAIGYKVREMDNNKENSFCCGSCGGLPRVDAELANNLAKERILQAKRIGVKKMVVIGFENFHLLNKNSKNLGIEIVELSDALAYVLGIKKREVIKEEEIEGENKILEENTEAEINIIDG